MSIDGVLEVLPVLVVDLGSDLHYGRQPAPLTLLAIPLDLAACCPPLAEERDKTAN